MKFKNYILFLSLIFLILLNGCQKPEITATSPDLISSTDSLEQKNDIELDKTIEIIVNEGWKHASIKDADKIKTILSLIEQSEFITELNSGQDLSFISGEFVLSNGLTIPFSLDDEHLFIQDRSYQRMKIVQLYTLLSNAVYSPEVLINAVESSNAIILKAGDNNLQITLSDQQRLEFIKAFLTAELVFLDYPIIEATPYPNQQIILQLDNETQLLIWISMKGKLCLEGYIWYDSNGIIKDIITKMLPVIPIDDFSKVESLFNYDQVSCTDIDGSVYDYSNRTPWFARIIIGEGNNDLVKQPSELEKADKIILNFKNDKQEIEVKIYKDGYIFNKQYYSKPGILDEINSMMTAG